MENIKILQARKLFRPRNNKIELHSKFWFKKDGQSYMFKMPTKSLDVCSYKFSLFNEVFISKLCKNLNIDCQEANFARYKFWDERGILIKSFLKNGQSEVRLYDMQCDYIESRLNDLLGNDCFEKYIYPVLSKKPQKCRFTDKILLRFSVEKIKGNIEEKLEFIEFLYSQIGLVTDISRKFNPMAIDIVSRNRTKLLYLSNILKRNVTDRDIVQFARLYATKHNLKLDNHFVDQLCAYAVFDYLTVQDDRNSYNISFIKENDTLKLAPIFDNEMCFPVVRGEIKNACGEFKNIANINILLTDLSKSKIDDKNSLVYKYKTSLSEFLENGFDSFAEEFIKDNPDCADFIFDERKQIYSQNDVLEHFKIVKKTMQNRLNDLEKNKNKNFNAYIGVFENQPQEQVSEKEL